MRTDDSTSFRAALTARLTRLWDGLDTPSTVIWLIIGYCAIHWVIRMGLSPVFSLDEAEQVLFAQELNWGYRFRHPPLITWLTWGVQQLAGLDGWALYALKYGLMAGGFVAYFYAARAVLLNTRLAALATFAFTLTYTVGYYPHLDLMHTVLLTAMLGAGILVAVRVLEHGTWSDYLLFGAVTAFGILSKYVYGLMPLAMLLAALAIPALRARLDPLKSLTALGVAGLIMAPYVAWALSFDYSMVGLAQTMTEADERTPMLLGWLQGTAMLAWSLVEFTLPFSLVFAGLFWARLREPADASDPGRARLLLYGRFFEVAMLIGAGFMLLAVVFGGATHFKGRWMHQVLMPLPIALFARLAVQATPLPWGRLKTYAGIVAVMAVVVITARIASFELNEARCNKCWEYQPFPSYAEAMRDDGFTGEGTILVSNMYVGGNLRAQFPQARVLIDGYPLSIFPDAQPDPVGACVLAWLGEDRDLPRKLVALKDRVGLAPLPADHRRGRVRSRIGPDNPRWFMMNYIIVPGGAGECR